MDGGAWLAAVHGVAKSRTRLSNFTFTFHFHALQKDKEIQPVHSEGDQPWNDAKVETLEGMTLKLKLQYFGHLMQ